MGVSLSKPSHPRASTTPSSLAKDSKHFLFDPRHERCRSAGDGAPMVGLGQFIAQSEWHNLLLGLSPDGTEKWVQNAGDPNRQSCVCATFEAPKAFAVLYAASGTEEQRQLREIEANAVLKALERAEEICGYARRGESANDAYERAALIWGLFRHYSSQANDPYIHTHAYLVNIGILQDGTTGAIRNIGLFGDIKALNAVFEAELARGVRELGFTVEPHPKQGFTIKEVPEEVNKLFSTRSEQIKQEMERRGSTSQKALSYAAKSTRPDKEILSHNALVFRWQKKMKDFGFEPAKIATPSKSGNVSAQEIDLSAVLAESLKNSPERGRNHHIEVVRSAAIQHGLSGERVKDAFEKHLPHGLVWLKWNQVFKNAPSWNPAVLLKVPVVQFGNPKEFRRWGKISFEHRSIFGDLRVQERYLFPNAPRWNPAHNWKLRALRFGKFRLRESEIWGKIEKSKNLGVGELRIQERKIFPRAMPWNPAKNLTVRTVRFVPKSSSKSSERHQSAHSH